MKYIESVLNEEDTWNDYPAAAKKNAQKAIDWKEEHGRDEVDAGTPVGWARAHQLAKGENLSTDTVKRMSAFNRHRKNSSIKPELKATPWKDRGYVAWLIWGGDEGVDWAIEKSKEIDAMKESNQMKYIKPIGEAKRGAIHKAAKKGSYPVSIVVINSGMVVKQELVDTPAAVPAVFNELQKQYPNAVISVESNTGETLFSESVELEDVYELIAHHKFDKDFKKLSSKDREWVKNDAKERGFTESVNEAKAYKLKASEFGADTHSAAYNVKGEPTWRVHSTYAIDQVSGENNPEERDVVFFEAMPINNDIYIKIGGINNLKRTNGSTYGNNFGTTIDEWKIDPKGIAKEASDFLTDATHLKWINKKARSEGQTIKWALKDDYSSVIEDLVNKALGLKESVNEGKIKYKKGKTYQSEGPWTVVVDSNSSGLDIRVNNSAGWRLDPHDEKEETFQLLDNGTQRAVMTFKEGNIDAFAQKMWDRNSETTHGEKEGLTSKDYADIIRVWIDMRKANETVVVKSGFVKTLNEYFGNYEYDRFIKQYGKIKYPKYIGVKIKELVAGGFVEKMYGKESNYMSFWLNQMGDRKFDTAARKKELGEIGYKLSDLHWNDLTGYTAFVFVGAEAAYEVSKHIQDRIANKEEIEPAYYMMKEYFNSFGMSINRSKIFNIAVEKLEKWMKDNAIETL